MNTQRIAAIATLTQDEAIVIRVARAITPTVVSVSQDEGSGSAIIVDRSGMVLTNAHVVGDSRTVGVGLADGRTLNGQVLGRDPTIDVAVVRVPAQNPPVPPIGDSDKLEVGQSAIASGSPTSSRSLPANSGSRSRKELSSRLWNVDHRRGKPD